MTKKKRAKGRSYQFPIGEQVERAFNVSLDDLPSGDRLFFTLLLLPEIEQIRFTNLCLDHKSDGSQEAISPNAVFAFVKELIADISSSYEDQLDLAHERMKALVDMMESISEIQRMTAANWQLKANRYRDQIDKMIPLAKEAVRRAKRGGAYGKKRSAKYHARIIEIWQTNLNVKGKHPSGAWIFKNFRDELQQLTKSAVTQDAIEKVIARHKNKNRQNDLSQTN